MPVLKIFKFVIMFNGNKYLNYITITNNCIVCYLCIYFFLEN